MTAISSLRGSKSRSKLNKKESEVKPKRPCVYILCNKPNGTLYVGVTSDLQSRIYHPKIKLLAVLPLNIM
ncbi:GIY-YIG nuclease family protein [Campylobacter upsaliensis]|uniref:GIY-YIG nuclease family protein n=1 Tax=Campylobacter upsaliensis TaxID=28080 RepID=UPI002227ABE2|nr:GIY-YIG nuclease family protein [Campylobacter upsaliensis]EIW9954483.1 GIY-YIG nuclease family protein [Campylobacter upsaliensis]EKR5435755.1 GIY-YIG nuclease family protein [Campylobacter upsaliensis]ELY5425280.1 GIY-YIG nuclease family protein [Campylobacter upsaliensis]ELZ2672543.1 GIY-YIG nuclease family protein [Campylobacter upsaliensis]MEB2798416.1 GIY-YIG nuclease family protein [Campylobacter upsaliensis]